MFVHDRLWTLSQLNELTDGVEFLEPDSNCLCVCLGEVASIMISELFFFLGHHSADLSRITEGLLVVAVDSRLTKPCHKLKNVAE